MSLMFQFCNQYFTSSWRITMSADDGWS